MNNLKYFTSFRRRERKIHEIETELAALKCDQIKLRQGCKHNIQILTRPLVGVLKKEVVPHCQCLYCGHMYADKNAEKLRMATAYQLFEQEDELYLIIDSEKHNINNLRGEEKIAEIELICEKVICKHADETVVVQLKAIRDELSKFQE